MYAPRRHTATEVEAQQRPIDGYDWDRAWAIGNMPRKQKFIWGGIVTVEVIVCIIALILYSPSISSEVGISENAVKLGQDGSVQGVSGPGRVFHGLYGGIEVYPRHDMLLEYTTATGNPITARLRDGQIVTVDVSLNIAIPKEKLRDIYRLHSKNFYDIITAVATDALLNVVSQFNSSDFLDNRKQVTLTMRAQLTEEAEERLVRLTGLQIRNVILPPTLLDNLFNLQLQRLQVNRSQEYLVLDQINANTNALELELRTARLQGLAIFDRETTLLLSREAQNRSRVEAQTRLELARINGTATETLRLFEEDTAAQVEQIRLNITNETEHTRRAIARVQHESETLLAVYRQETDNMRLQYQNNVTLINERAKQDVAEIITNTTLQVKITMAQLSRAVHYARSAGRSLIASAHEHVANITRASYALALTSMPPEVYLARSMAYGALEHTKFFDANMTSLIYEASYDAP